MVIGKALKKLASTDPLIRVRALEKVVERLLWRLPREQIEQHLEIPPALPQAGLAVQPYGVSKAVNEFVIRESYVVCGLALEPAGNLDILLKK